MTHRLTPVSPAGTSRPRPVSWRFTGGRPRPAAVSSPRPTPRASSALPRTCAASRPAWTGSSVPSKNPATMAPAMTHADNSSFLAQANARRRQAALSAAHHAIERLQREGKAVSFSAIAQSGGVSRGWLYRQDQIRDLISRLRHLEPPAARVTAQRASADSLRQRPDAARAEITRLRAENTPSASRSPAISASSEPSTASTRQPSRDDPITTPPTPLSRSRSDDDPAVSPRRQPGYLES